MKKFLYSIPLTALLLITACGKEEIATVTKEEFDQLQKGMTYEKVVEIVGGDAKKENVIEEGHIVEYSFDSESDSDVSLIFVNGKLDTKLGYQSNEKTIITSTDEKIEKVENTFEQQAESNAKAHPAKPAAKLFGEEVKGLPYYFKGELIDKKQMEGLFGGLDEAWLVKNENGYVMPVFPLATIESKPGDTIEVWGSLSGDGYANADLEVDNVVGMTGAINATTIKINGEKY